MQIIRNPAVQGALGPIPRSANDCDTQTSFLSNANTHRLIGLASTGVTGQERWQFLEDIWTLLKIHASWFHEWVETLTWERPLERVRNTRRPYLPPQHVDDIASKTRDQ
jgi:hypothetical protein